MKNKKYAARVVEINNFFKYFPVDTTTVSVPDKLPKDELVNIQEFGAPPTWQKEMIIQNFDVTSASINDFIDFCECLEMAKDLKTRQNNRKNDHKEKAEKSTKHHSSNWYGKRLPQKGTWS